MTNETNKPISDVGPSTLSDMLGSFEELLEAAYEYVDYKHNGDPWTEDARAMGEMTLNDMSRDGRLERCKQLIHTMKYSPDALYGMIKDYLNPISEKSMPLTAERQPTVIKDFPGKAVDVYRKTHDGKLPTESDETS